MASLAITCIVIIGTWAIVLYVIHMVRPRRVRLKAMLGRIISIDFEADGGESSGSKAPRR